MNKLYFLLVLIVAMGIQTVKGQNGWFAQWQISGNQSSIVGIKFIDADTGFLIANQGISSLVLKTSDGGNSWDYDTSFLHNLYALEVIGNKQFVGGQGGNLYQKSGYNGSWSSVSSTLTTQINDIQFIDADTGFIVGVNGNLRKTVNGGLSWSNPWIGAGLTTYDFNAVYFTDGNNGNVVGVYNFFQGFAVRTISGGAYWSLPSSMPSKLNELTFTSSQIGYAVGNGGTVYKTTNAGVGWLLKTTGFTNQLWDLSFVNDSVGYVVGDNGLIIKTIDGGNSWQQQASPFNISQKSVFALNQNSVWAGTDTSLVLHTSTGGLSLSVLLNDTVVYCTSTIQFNPIINYNGSSALQYSWSSNPLLNDTSIANPLAGPISSSSLFIITVSDGLVSATDSAVVNLISLPPDSICLVSVFDSVNHNVIVFEKHVQGAIDYYIIHKESNVANVYDSIGFIPADSAGIFVDTAVNPMVQAYRYKISSVDSCGNHSIMSNHHKTIHLTINQGLPGTWNLIWNNYEGVFINTYRIWRGTQPNNMVLLDSVAGNMTSYTDIAPPSGSVFYQIEIVSSYMCKPYDYKAQTNYNTSRSNKANTGIPQTITADFSALPATGTAPLSVSFSDNSIGTIDNWLWFFGDGDTSSLQNPVHIYTSPGIYDVTLIVNSGLLIDSITKTAFIDVISSIEEVDINNALTIYPNPNKQGQNCRIELSGAKIFSVEIFDMFGKRISDNKAINDNSFEIIGNFPAGVYQIRIATIGGKLVYRKLVVQ